MRPARILVVDDEPGMLRVAERVLGRRYEVTTCASSREAVARAGEIEPDLAILDIRMPEMDGFELMARLKAKQPGLDFILMTGSVSEPDQKLIRTIREQAFYFLQKPFDREVLETLVDRCLELRRLGAENRRHVRQIEGELAQARAFQQRLLPPPEAIVEGVTLSCRYEPCLELAGDFFDYCRVGEGRCALLVADVSGHGVSAAMLTGIVKAAFHSSHADGYDPLVVVDRVRTGIATFGDERFITMFCAMVAPVERRLEYVSAGHPPALLWGPGRERVERLGCTGPIVSPAFPQARWERGLANLTSGDRLLVYTDGVTEAQGEDGFFGEERILTALKVRREGGSNLIEEILGAVRHFSHGRPLRDDLTLLAAGVV